MLFLLGPCLALVAACGGTTSAVGTADGGADDGSSLQSDAHTSITDGSTTTADAASDGGKKSSDPSCSTSTTQGTSCSVEGAFCQPSACTDECQFCNSLHCSSGKWQTMEAFPMPEAWCASASCGTLTCGKGEMCVKTGAGANPSFKCAKLTQGCWTCACATDPACAGTKNQCTLDPTSSKPSLDCTSP